MSPGLECRTTFPPLRWGADHRKRHRHPKLPVQSTWPLGGLPAIENALQWRSTAPEEAQAGTQAGARGTPGTAPGVRYSPPTAASRICGLPSIGSNFEVRMLRESNFRKAARFDVLYGISTNSVWWSGFVKFFQILIKIGKKQRLCFDRKLRQ